MLWCNSFFARSRRVFAVVTFASFSLLCVSPARAQNFRSVSPSVDRRAGGTVSVRDLTIPPKAFENYQRGLQQLQKQDPVKGMHYFTKAIEKYPDFYEAYYHLGVAQKRLGQEDQALASFQTAINLSNGRYALAAYGYALLLCKRGKMQEAERTVRYALDLEQNRPIGEVVLGTVYLYQNRPEEAEKSAREALFLDPDTPDAYLVLAGVHGQKGNYADEVKDLDEFIALEPNTARTHSVCGIRQVAANLAARLGSKSPVHSLPGFLP